MSVRGGGAGGGYSRHVPYRTEASEPARNVFFPKNPIGPNKIGELASDWSKEINALSRTCKHKILSSCWTEAESWISKVVFHPALGSANKSSECLASASVRFLDLPVEQSYPTGAALARLSARTKRTIKGICKS